MSISAREMEPGFDLPAFLKKAKMPISAETGYDGPVIHSDEAARKMGYARGIVPGNTTIAYLSEMLTNFFGEGWVKGGKSSVSFIGPVYDGDELTCRGTVRSRASEGSSVRLVLDVWIENPQGEKVVVGTASGLVT